MISASYCFLFHSFVVFPLKKIPFLKRVCCSNSIPSIEPSSIKEEVVGSASAMAVMPPPTMADIQRRTMTIMRPHSTATATGELCVQHSPTMVVPDIMAVGITGGIVI
jgi:hypothetical protein